MLSAKQQLNNLFNSSPEFRNKLFRLALTILFDSDLAEEAVHDAFIKATKNIEKFKGEAALSTWITRILINQCYDIRKINRKDSRYIYQSSSSKDNDDRVLNLEDTREDIYKKIELSQRSESLITMVNRLDHRYKVVLILRFYQNKTYTEMSEILDTNEGTIKSRLYTAKLHLKALLAEEGIEI